MPNIACHAPEGYICPVRGCDKKKNRRFRRLLGLVMHMEEKHNGYIEKKLNLKWKARDPGS